VVWLDRDTFDHRFTDYELIGRHKLTECSGRTRLLRLSFRGRRPRRRPGKRMR
jgi:hypothetical protein